MRHAGGAAGTERELARFGFGEAYEFRHGLHGNGRVHRQHARDQNELGHGVEILDRIVGDLFGRTDIGTVRA